MPSVEPTDLVRTAGRLSELVFAHEFGRVPWLLVRVGAGDDELAAALRAADAHTAPVRAPGQLAFHTEVVSESALASRRNGMDGATPDWASVIRSLGDDRYHAVALQKRPGVDAVFEGRISIGRALNKDIVLRHASISKFHAYFECEDPGRCVVADAGSKNGTALNGTRLAPREPAAVVSGDRVTFGSIATVVVDARTLWRVLRER